MIKSSGDSQNVAINGQPDITAEAAEVIKNGKDILIKGADVKMGIAKKIVEENNKKD